MLMTRQDEIIELAQWFSTPAGRYVHDWEQQQVDRCVMDLFGFHALQVGLQPFNFLRANRMPHRWLATDSGAPSLPGASVTGSDPTRSAALLCDFEALPFPSGSLDLVVLPHTLEISNDPHQTLAEVERVLMPEGRVVIVGFNPASLWGLRQVGGRCLQSLPGRLAPQPFLPSAGEFLGFRRLRDWLRLLSFEVEGGRFGCYRPPCRTERWLQRYEKLESVGQHWWPVFGAVYVLVAVKRVRGMRLVGMVRRQQSQGRTAPVVVANRHKELM